MATATSTQPPRHASGHSTNPLSLWHLLSLDAPTIDALWTWFIASANHIRLPLASTLAMALAVWVLYAADRLMDARLIETSPIDTMMRANPFHHEDLEARHYFHSRHRPAFLWGILLAALALAALLPRLDAEAIRLYLTLGALVAGYFLLIHATNSAAAKQKLAHRFPKEIAVGLCFAAATFIPTVARRPSLRLPLLPSALLFATLCSLNCLFIYAWEHDAPPASRPAHSLTRLALRHLSFLAILLSLAALALSLFDRHAPRSIPLAIAAASALLLLLDKNRQAISRVTLRAAADLALTTPILLLPFLLR